MAAIEVQHVSKSFPARRGARDLRGRGGLRDWILGRKSETFEALKDITFSVEQGETLGIIGRNGSGKSTLLSILAGVTLPSGGSVTVRGRIASLLELGAGFHPILTGRENIYLNGAILGMTKEEIDARFDDIIAFSEIGEFIDTEVKFYSSGMYLRLAFAVAVHTDPDVFLVDEILAVGDEPFQRKCITRIKELVAAGKTLVVVSHDLNLVQDICSRGIVMEKGRLAFDGSCADAVGFLRSR